MHSIHDEYYSGEDYNYSKLINFEHTFGNFAFLIAYKNKLYYKILGKKKFARMEQTIK